MKRQAAHAGSWYTDKKQTLDHQLDAWLAEAGVEAVPGARIIIGPHAGYSYSGPTAASAYGALDVSKAKRCFILGPSHHAYLDGCALSSCESYATPLGDLAIDASMNEELYSTGKFTRMSRDTDENEHSIEMHLPYTYKILSRAFPRQMPPTVPILVGSITRPKEETYGKLLAPYLSDPSNVFIVSSDFCHWGSRFSYTSYIDSAKSDLGVTSTKPKDLEIWKSIEMLDHAGMDAIESGSLQNFVKYMQATKNTICGRHPIAVMMAAMQIAGGRFTFNKYAQSGKVTSARDTSVSYASAYAII